MFDLKFYQVIGNIYKTFVLSFHDWREMRKMSIKFNRCHNGNKYQQLAEMINADEMTMLYFHRFSVYFDICCFESSTL